MATLGTPQFTVTTATTQPVGDNSSVNVASTSFVQQAISAIFPTGIIMKYGGNVAPTYWLLCDGTAVSRVTYATLFATIGTTYGVGDGSTTFNTPDFRRRAPVGQGGTASGTLSNTVGSVGGAETHTLTTAQLASHTHTQNSHNHTQDAHAHAVVLWGAGPTATPNLYSGTTTAANSGTPDPTYNGSIAATNQAATATNQNAGSDQAHNNLQPSLVVSFIIKV
jgi:microcystin-dependent protein